MASEVTDGPFAETTEQLGGYFLIRVANLDEAIAVASRIPGLWREKAEIWPLYPLPERSRVEHEASASVDRGSEGSDQQTSAADQLTR